MTTQITFNSSTVASEINVDKSSLEDTRRCLAATGYELLEMREFEDGCNDETWISSSAEEKIRLIITTQDNASEPLQDASRAELVDEVINLWFELRAIRNILSDDLDEILAKSEETPMERFFSTVQYFQKERESAPDTWRFMFSADVDEAICAFNDLKESDRLAIIQ